MNMRLETFVFTFAALLVVPLYGMSDSESAQVSYVKASASSDMTRLSNTDKQFVSQAAQQEPSLRGLSPEPDEEVQMIYNPLQESQLRTGLSTRLSASASHLASRSDNSLSAQTPPLALILPETDVQSVVTVTEQIETKTEQHAVYDVSDDAVSRLLQENYQRIASYNPYHAWLLAQVIDFCVEGRPVIQVYLDARYDEQKDAIIQTIESMNPGLNRRYEETPEDAVVDREGKPAAADISINDTTSDGTTTTSTGSLSTTQPASAITTQSCDMQESASAHDWTSQVFVAPAVERGTNTAHVTTSTGATTTTHSTASADISDDNDESGVSRSCVITSRPGADTH